MILTSDKNFMMSLFTASDDINIRQNSMIAVFYVSDDMNIRENSMIAVFLHLMILTPDKIQ